MAKKAAHHGHAPAPLEPRIHRAVHEGRFQQALELAKQLHKQEPSPPHLELLQKAYLGRAKQLREQGYGRDAVTMLEAAARLDMSSPVWIEQVAREIAQSGGVRLALSLVEQLPPETPGLAAIRAHAVDGAVQLEAAGREQLPPVLHSDFDRVLLAFQQVEQGQDEQAKATLQEIGLRSPFLEWKVLLRGFQAYYQNDDARALENWQRLTADRLPARLAAPFRSQIDPAYRAAQTPATQNSLQTLLDRSQGSVLPQELRRLRHAMDSKETLAPAFRQAEALLPQLKQQVPQLVPRLANCFYWAAINTGPDDVGRYQRAFGPPVNDPHFHRLQAIANDRGGDLKEAHFHWKEYEKDLAAHPEIFPAGQAERARALIWLHMGRNAAGIPSKKKMAKLPKALRDFPGLPRALSPSAEQCLEKAIGLAPDQLEPYEELFKHFLFEEKNDKAVKAASRLLERFPDHAPTLAALGNLRMNENKYAEGLELYQRALRSNPLDRDLRQRVSAAHVFQARIELEAGNYEEARRHYQGALAHEREKELWAILLRWAACEFKAGNDARAAELLQQTVAKAPHPLVVSFVMLSEVLRVKLSKELKKRFDKEFKAGLTEPPHPEAAAALVDYLASLKGMGITYTGLKTHESTILRYVNRGQTASWEAPQLEAVIRALLHLKAIKPARRFLLNAHRFSKDPVFPLLDAMSHFIEAPKRMQHYHVRMLLTTADRLAQALPPDERRTKLLEDIQHHQQLLDALDPYGPLQNVFSNIFDFGAGPEDADFDDDDDDGW